MTLTKEFVISSPNFSKNENAKMQTSRVSEGKQKLVSCLPSGSDVYGAKLHENAKMLSTNPVRQLLLYQLFQYR